MNIIIVGTVRTEIEDNILYYSCLDFFDVYKTYLETEYKDMENQKRDKKVKREIQNYITQIQLQTQVSQSIGRNSGFRDQGKKTVVVLPLLMPNSTRKFKPIGLNYISPNVEIMQD